MRDRWPPKLFLCFTLAIAAGWVVNDPVFSRASTSASAIAAAVSQTEPPTGGQPANPDSGSSTAPPASAPAAPDSVPAAPPGSTPAAAPDSVSAAPPDTAASAPDSVGVSAKPSQTALPDTLQFLPPPGTATGGAAKPGDKPAAPKERVGLFGIHPIAILFGIAVLNYFIIKAATD